MTQNKIDHLLQSGARVCIFLCALFLPISLFTGNVFFVSASALCAIRHFGLTVHRTVWSHPVAGTFLAYFLLLALGLTYTSAPMSEAFPMFMKYNKLLLAVPLFSLPFDQKWYWPTVCAFIFSMILTMVLGLLKVFGVSQFGAVMGDASVFTRHITTNWYMSIACYFVLCFILQKPKQRFYWLLLVALMVYYILFCNEGRTGYVVLGVLFFYALWHHANWRGIGMASILIPTMLCLAFVGSAHFRERVTDVKKAGLAYYHGDNTVTSMSLRLRYAENSLRIIRAHPWIGAGTGSMLHETQKIESSPEYQTRNPHNEFLNQWAQLGTIGFILFLLFLLWQWVCANLFDEERLLIIRGLLLALVSGSLMNSLLMDSLEGHLYVFFIAISMALPARTRLKE